MTSSAKLILALVLVLWNKPAVAQNGPQTSPQHTRVLSREQIKAVILAVEDEIYDYSQESSFIFAGVIAPKGPTDRSATLPLYVAPSLQADGRGEVIYRNLPYGEILREFRIRSDGMVIFDSDPQIGFPVTQPSHLTEFMDKSELRLDKTHWLHGTFRIQIDPPRGVVVGAAKRQLRRVGFSDFLATIGRSGNR